MLAYFPRVYPDELLYSVLARYHRHTCSQSPKQTIQDLFGATGVKANVALQSRIAALCQNIPADRGLDPEKLIKETTLLPYYVAFATEEVTKFAISQLTDGHAESVFARLGIAASVISAPDSLRYCPVCLSEMQRQYGEWYWRRSHQLPGVLLCPDHKVFLVDSSMVPNGENQHAFIACSLQNCKLLALAKSWECEPQGMTLLQDIADRSASLLAAALKHEECRDWGVYYLAAVRNRGFAKGKQRVDQASFREAFSRFFAPIANVVPQAFNGDWPVAMVRKHRKAFHPLQHILLQMFLDRYPVIVKPADPSFEEGPWECLNHLAEHFGRKVVESLTVRREMDRFVGRFSCACGCSYTRVAGSSIPPHIGFFDVSCG
ncbi:TnsD family Tn7-like transposition protein [Acidithiobacillus sp. AMEEHan]|uniref:TnsD family Tn7-like transposition protein n=1 Tax=Acidithiobacillus sp. AMEEHan TaxID=2994951 RepID=UPI0027E5158A|nr:TnsD family Tn7-like transposition protein [Acidithiobacillus sp. AMEEHan]